jgi:hypothetical protein
MGLLHLAVVVLEQIGAGAVEDPGAPAPSEAPWRPVEIPSPAASTPTRSTSSPANG